MSENAESQGSQRDTKFGLFFFKNNNEKEEFILKNIYLLILKDNCGMVYLIKIKIAMKM